MNIRKIINGTYCIALLHGFSLNLISVNYHAAAVFHGEDMGSIVEVQGKYESQEGERECGAIGSS